MKLAYRTAYVKIVSVGLVWSVDVRFLLYCSLLLVSLVLFSLESGCEVFFALLQFAVSSFVLFSFCSMLLLLMWLFCLGLYEVYFSLLEKAYNCDNL
jgi:hypothetical protein